jgi:hypothetical protein
LEVHMKMVKSLLLGSAAAFVAVAGAQAADLPVKAKAAEYVKVCKLYGAGYYYIPGTDTCIKVGGYVRAQYEVGATNGGIPDIMGGAQGGNTRTQAKYGYRGRGYLTIDAREQTQYGVLRSYMAIAAQNTDVTTDAIHTETAFIQFAGFTAGIGSSFYDFHSFAPYGYVNQRVGSNLGAAGGIVLGYTAQFGGGVSASVAVEDNSSRRALLLDMTAVTAQYGILTMGTAPTSDYSANRVPDIVGNLRVDQTWGSIQVMGAAHLVSAAYWTVNAAGLNAAPSDVWGWAGGVGVQLNVPGMPGDLLIVQANWAKGAVGYISGTNTLYQRQSGSSIGYGLVADAVLSGATPGVFDLTNAWGFTATYQHQWTPTLKTSINGGYQAYDYNTAANAAICANAGAFAALANCNNDFSVWAVGSRTEWAAAKNLNIGLDVVYTKLRTASAGASTVGLNSGNVGNSNVLMIGDQDVWAVAMRWQRNFWP